jgi:hypothetical protein
MPIADDLEIEIRATHMAIVILIRLTRSNSAPLAL